MISKITKEIDAYLNQSIDIFEGYSFSPYRLLRRIGLYKNHIYPTGKFDSQGNYKYWFDVISPRVNAEVKNIDFDTKDILLYSDVLADSVRVMMANIAMKDYLSESGEAEKLNEAVEQGSELGNVVWKKDKKSYRILELNNLMVLNGTAKTLEDSDVIESEVMLATDLRKKVDVWNNVEKLIKNAKADDKKTSPEFYIYERNGEVSEKEYIEGKDLLTGQVSGGGREDKYLLAKVIVGGLEKGNPTEVLFCEEIDKKPYKEYHRTAYAGRWLRMGLYEILMDIQTRANEIGNQIARGLEWSSKTLFRSSDKVIAQNILTDLQNGDIIKSIDLQQVQTRMQGFDQLIADWNRLMKLADELANSYEVVTGENSPSGTPFRLATQQNFNANKLFDFIREKLALSFQEVIEDWILPGLLANLKTKEILRITADSGMLNQYYQVLVDDWYIKNLLALPPHDEAMAQEIKSQKLQEISKNQEAIVELEKGMWKDFYPRVRVSITGENVNLGAEMESLSSFIALEGDPVRRTALIEMAMKKKNIDVSSLPKSPPVSPQVLQPKVATQTTQ